MLGAFDSCQHGRPPEGGQNLKITRKSSQNRFNLKKTYLFMLPDYSLSASLCTDIYDDYDELRFFIIF